MIIDAALATTVAIVFVLLLMSAFFSGSETALTATSRARIHALERGGDQRASIVARLIGNRERMIGAMLIGNNIVNILASALATSALLKLFGQAGVAVATVVMTTLVIIFSEVLPKTWAIGNPDRFALTVSRPIRLIVALLGPLAALVQWIVRGILSLFGLKIDAGVAVLSAHEELRGAVDLLHMEGGVVKSDRDMMGGVLDLRELEVSDIMVHRTKMRSLNADDPPAQVVSAVLASPFTRMPIWRDEPDNIVGILHAKDLLRALDRAGGDFDKIDLMAIASDPWYVPDTTSVDDQLKAFLKRKTHLALVVDEYGEVQGLVTLEDILEEIVGEIADEQDIVIQGVRPLPDGSVNVDGSVPIRDLNRVMDWRLPDEEATTIAGLVIHEARLIPEPGQTFTFYGFRFQVLRKTRNRITSIRITPVEKLRGGARA
ncbi:Magnesium and cobalt efflux protein CorC [Hartmannibacter diazotrophicus]|uniref:Magnesium and cobalt efflux protein CorC n=1 Tax=Hartmannibacter diazotrophicus TaxID=1482074 RepID=A0A2C9DDM6_9HYPH|nr:HlyC/CorC family transporter [Hartmannibacter diazotrophicus]SON57861.1 Magnesium and cobalt efflux protein CorC [Hartmannibacter diazotrophicus]